MTLGEISKTDVKENNGAGGNGDNSKGSNGNNGTGGNDGNSEECDDKNGACEWQKQYIVCSNREYGKKQTSFSQ